MWCMKREMHAARVAEVQRKTVLGEMERRSGQWDSSESEIHSQEQIAVCRACT